MMRGVDVVELRAEDTHPLRRAVLRDHLPAGDAGARDVDYASDRVPGSFHLGVRDAAGRPIAIASFTPEPSGDRPGRRAMRLLGMAVEPGTRGAGLGRAIVDAALARLRADGVEVCWANARSSALGFYERLGFSVVGDEFERVGLPHRIVLIELDPPPAVGR